MTLAAGIIVDGSLDGVAVSRIYGSIDLVCVVAIKVRAVSAILSRMIHVRIPEAGGSLRGMLLGGIVAEDRSGGYYT